MNRSDAGKARQRELVRRRNLSLALRLWEYLPGDVRGVAERAGVDEVDVREALLEAWLAGAVERDAGVYSIRQSPLWERSTLIP